jgi:hypothetical protein
MSNSHIEKISSEIRKLQQKLADMELKKQQEIERANAVKDYSFANNYSTLQKMFDKKTIRSQQLKPEFNDRRRKVGYLEPTEDDHETIVYKSLYPNTTEESYIVMDATLNILKGFHDRLEKLEKLEKGNP